MEEPAAPAAAPAKPVEPVAEQPVETAAPVQETAPVAEETPAAVAEPAGRMKRKRNTTAPKSGSLRQIGFGGAEQKMSGRPKEHY